MKIILFISILLVSMIEASWKKERESLDKIHQVNEFRIFYTLHGVNALEDNTDLNNNNIPDIIENIGLQLDTANQLFHNIFEFERPLVRSRYKNTVKYIDVHILSLGYNGNSGDAVILYDYKIIKENTKSLSIAISNKIQFDNLTPAHELFHVYQNAYTMFKNRWFTEGTARWSEYAFKKRTGKQHNLPSTISQLETLLNQTYEAKYFWNRLLFLCAKDDKGFQLPLYLKERVYIGTKIKIIEDDTLFGYKFLYSLFENLDKMDNIVTKDRNLKMFKWKEKEQKSFINNKYILRALQQTILANSCTNVEVQNFLTLIDLYLALNKNLKNVTKAMKTIGIPYKNKYKDGENIYARNVWDMQFFNDALYIAAGNSSNSHPAPNAGPVPIISYSPSRNIFIEKIKVHDEQIDVFRVLNDFLYIPGHDSTENRRFGHLYRKSKNTPWESFYNIPDALHVFDIISYKNELIAGISTPKGAAVAVSNTNAKDWKIKLLGARQRTYSLLEVNTKLYAVKQSLSKRKKVKLSQNELDNYSLVFEYKDGDFIPRKDITREMLFPHAKANKTIRISKSERVGKTSLYISAWSYINPFGIFRIKELKNKSLEIKQIKIPKEYTPRDILVRNKKVYFLCTQKSGNRFKNVVFESDLVDVLKPKKLFYFESTAFARSFEKDDYAFYFGLGCDVKNKKKWRQKELKVNTGMIIKVEIKDI
ncbi:hypothetical protein JHD48_04620 [Sulfurimonas sp. SAG-AH-194-I05]|nr:hypothetical protein [Sulfurimonas sp. SAG-AH-194-I05]MDF1875014.1 hypothetical protein [Sulfurimonas sp. SAG-AH-194-I05]